MADPSIWLSLPHLLLSGKSPLKVRLDADPQQWRWLLEFMLACRRSTADHSTAQLLVLAALSRARFDRMMNEHSLECSFAENGKLVVYRSEKACREAMRQMQLQAELASTLGIDIKQEFLNREQTLALEPALHRTAPLLGAVYTQSECVVDCGLLCKALLDLLGQDRYKSHVEIRMSQSVEGFGVTGTAASAVRTATDSIACDAVVLCTGADANALLRQFGQRLPIYPVKGYSITLLSDCLQAMPKCSVTDSAAKVVYAPLNDHLRVAGFAHIVGYNKSLSDTDLLSLQKATDSIFGLRAPSRVSEFSPWAGLRPCTPTGLPYVGLKKGLPKNLLLNVGQGSLGMTLAFGCAAEIVTHLETRGELN